MPPKPKDDDTVELCNCDNGHGERLKNCKLCAGTGFVGLAPDVPVRPGDDDVHA